MSDQNDVNPPRGRFLEPLLNQKVVGMPRPDSNYRLPLEAQRLIHPGQRQQIRWWS